METNYERENSSIDNSQARKHARLLKMCPICGFQEEIDDFNKDEEICEKCGKSTYTFRSVNSIRKVFVGELKKEKAEKADRRGNRQRRR